MADVSIGIWDTLSASEAKENSTLSTLSPPGTLALVAGVAAAPDGGGSVLFVTIPCEKS